MAEDFHSKTEEPTPKKLADARKKGFVAKSNELIMALMLLGGVAIFFFFGPYMMDNLKLMFVQILINMDLQFAEISLISWYINHGLYELIKILLPLLFGTVFMAILFNVVQTGLLFTLYPLKPKLKKLNFFDPSNYEKNFGLPAMMRMVFGLTRLQAVVIISWFVIAIDGLVVFSYGKATPKEISALIYQKGLIQGIACSIAYLGVGILDYFFQKWRFMREMKMTRREVKDELKQLEGDQNLKIKIRTMMRNYAEVSRIADMPQADVVIADEMKFAVAIAYDPKIMRAPICICKGSRRRGAAILEAARKYGIPVVKNSALAQSIFLAIDNGNYISPDHYHAVANILMGLKPSE